MGSTISDVAKAAGLSTATVSKYLNHKPVSSQNMERISAAIEALDYHVNDFARGLRTAMSMTIGLLVPSTNNIFSISLIEQVEQLLVRDNYSIFYCQYGNDSKKLTEKLAFLRMKKVDGIIMLACAQPTDQTIQSMKQLQEDGIPIVFVNGKIDGIQADTVLVDTISSIYESIRVLILRGHRKIGMFALSPNIWNTREREQGYRRAFEDHQMTYEERLIRTEGKGELDQQTLRQEATDFLNRNPDMTALLLPGYQLTLAGLYALSESGKMIGRDIAVIGYDCADICDLVHPGLAYVSIPAEKIAGYAVDLLLSSMRQEERPIRLVRIPSVLVSGGSLDCELKLT